MSLNALMRWLKPREGVFFDLLEESAGNAYQAAQLFDREVRANNPERWPGLRREMDDFEHAGDLLTQKLIDRLNQTFVTPIERDDILHLTHALDDVVDRLDAVCERLVLYRIGQIRPAVMEISSLAVEGCQELVHLVRSLRDMSNTKDIRLRIRRVTNLENRVDAIYHTALADIFDSIQDPKELIKWKEILDNVEAATDLVDRVAKVLGSVVMRNA